MYCEGIGELGVLNFFEFVFGGCWGAKSEKLPESLIRDLFFSSFIRSDVVIRIFSFFFRYHLGGSQDSGFPLKP